VEETDRQKNGSQQVNGGAECFEKKERKMGSAQCLWERVI